MLLTQGHHSPDRIKATTFPWLFQTKLRTSRQTNAHRLTQIPHVTKFESRFCN